MCILWKRWKLTEDCSTQQKSLFGLSRFSYWVPLDINMLVLPQKTIKILLWVLAAKILTMWQLLVNLFTALFLFILYRLLKFHRGNKVPDTHQFYENDWQTWSFWTKDKKTNESLEKWEVVVQIKASLLILVSHANLSREAPHVAPGQTDCHQPRHNHRCAQ